MRIVRKVTCLYHSNYNNSFHTGVRNNIDQEEGLYHYEMKNDGDRELQLYHHPSTNGYLINQGAYIHKNTLFLYGTSNQNLSIDTIDVDGYLMQYDFVTHESTYDFFDYGALFIDIYDLQADTDSTLIFFSRRRQPEYHDDMDYVIEKIRPDGSRYELYNAYSPENNFTTHPSAMTVLANGNIVTRWPNAFGGSQIANTFRFIDREGNYLFDTSLEHTFFPDYTKFYDMTSLADGGLLLIGKYIDRTDIPTTVNQQNGLLLKLDGNGELVWSRQYKNYDSITEEYIESSISEAKEMVNGDIVAIGRVYQTATDLWVLKVDSNGCFGPDDCGDITVSSADIELEKANVDVFPNPTSTYIEVEIGRDSGNGFLYDIYSLQGKKLQSGIATDNSQVIELGSKVSSGVFILKVRLETGMVITRKVVKI